MDLKIDTYGVLRVTDYKSKLNIQKFKMAEQNVKSFLIWIMFGIRAFLRSLIMDLSLKFRNSNKNISPPYSIHQSDFRNVEIRNQRLQKLPSNIFYPI